MCSNYYSLSSFRTRRCVDGPVVFQSDTRNWLIHLPPAVPTPSQLWLVWRLCGTAVAQPPDSVPAAGGESHCSACLSPRDLFVSRLKVFGIRWRGSRRQWHVPVLSGPCENSLTVRITRSLTAYKVQFLVLSVSLHWCPMLITYTLLSSRGQTGRSPGACYKAFFSQKSWSTGEKSTFRLFLKELNILYFMQQRIRGLVITHRKLKERKTYRR